MKKHSFRQFPKALAAIFTLFLLLSLLMVPTVFAAEPGTILRRAAKDGNLQFYVQTPAQAVTAAEAHIGSNKLPVEDITLTGDVTIRTLIVMDNSLSIKESYRAQMKDVLNSVIDARQPNETITIGTYGKKLNILVKDSNDTDTLKNIVANLSYSQHKSYINDVLFDIFSTWAAEDNGKNEYRRIILNADGVDHQTIGYTSDELKDTITENTCPIYSLGCRNGDTDNNERLEEMFSLSRLTNGEYWLLDELIDNTMLTAVLSAPVSCYQTVPEDSMCDGSEQNVALTLGLADGSQVTGKTVMNMPFSGNGAMNVPSVSMAEGAEESGTESGEESVKDGDEDDDEEEEFPLLPVILLAAAALLALIIIVLLMRRRKKAADKIIDQAYENKNNVSYGNNYNSFGEAKTVGFDEAAAGHHDFRTMPDEDDETVYMKTNAPVLILTDIDDPGISHRCTINGSFIIGRGSDPSLQLALSDKSVSHKHCRISVSGQDLFIVDTDSKNGTYVDGISAARPIALTDGSTLKLGDSIFKVSIR